MPQTRDQSQSNFAQKMIIALKSIQQGAKHLLSLATPAQLQHKNWKHQQQHELTTLCQKSATQVQNTNKFSKFQTLFAHHRPT